MSTHYIKFKINKLLQEKMILIMETIAIFILALFVSVFLPQLLFQFVYATQELTAEPQALRYIPVVSFSVAILYFVYATVLVVMKKVQIMKLEKELSLLMTKDGCECGCGECMTGDHAHHESAVLSASTSSLAEAMKAPKKKASTKKKTVKKA